MGRSATGGRRDGRGPATGLCRKSRSLFAWATASMKALGDAVYFKDKSASARSAGSAEVGLTNEICVSAPVKTRGTADLVTFKLTTLRRPSVDAGRMSYKFCYNFRLVAPGCSLISHSLPDSYNSWQRVRDSNPCTGLERALIYFYKYPITSKFCVRLFCVAAFVAHIISE